MAARDPSAASARIADVMRTDVRSELESGRCQHGDRNDGSGSRVVDRDRGRPSRRCGLHEAGLGQEATFDVAARIVDIVHLRRERGVHAVCTCRAPLMRDAVLLGCTHVANCDYRSVILSGAVFGDSGGRSKQISFFFPVRSFSKNAIRLRQTARLQVFDNSDMELVAPTRTKSPI